MEARGPSPAKAGEGGGGRPSLTCSVLVANAIVAGPEVSSPSTEAAAADGAVERGAAPARRSEEARLAADPAKWCRPRGSPTRLFSRRPI